MYKRIQTILKNTGKKFNLKKHKQKTNLYRKDNKFIRDKLDNMLSPATKEYLKLEKEMQNELKMRHNKTFKHKIR